MPLSPSQAKAVTENGVDFNNFQDLKHCIREKFLHLKLRENSSCEKMMDIVC